MQNIQEQSLFSPSPHQQHVNPYDSLVFSLTSQNQTNNKINFNGLSMTKETMLLDSRGQQISRELNMLQNKLSMLEGKVQEIKTDRQQDSTRVNKNPDKPKYNLEMLEMVTLEEYSQENIQQNQQRLSSKTRSSNIQPGLITNLDRQNIGKIRKSSGTKTKKQHFIKTGIINTKNNEKSLNNYSIRSQKSQHSKKCVILQKQIQRLKMQSEKSSRSKGKFMKQLSISKEKIKNLTRCQNKYQKIIEQLTKKLNKSVSIRQKQKQIIQSQKLEIQQLRNTLKNYTKIIR